ncbi:MAG: hypothetical protein BMS9Abin13_022 [Patescibacteria group bacterium]|nr:MAG: hypothetical protein BMS9Abin13_022 [Patescibacteria group bacterium]
MKRKTIVNNIIAFIALYCISLVAIAGETDFGKKSGPLAYPWNMWTETTYDFHGKRREGLKFDGYVEQGVDWRRFGSWTLNTFVGARFTLSDRRDQYWNNKYGPWFGVKIRRNVSLSDGSWGVMSIGIRSEHYRYRGNGSLESDNRGVVYIQWSAGGNLKKGR